LPRISAPNKVAYRKAFTIIRCGRFAVYVGLTCIVIRIAPIIGIKISESSGTVRPRMQKFPPRVIYSKRAATSITMNPLPILCNMMKSQLQVKDEAPETVTIVADLVASVVAFVLGLDAVEAGMSEVFV
jgi:hypothetical protein